MAIEFRYRKERSNILEAIWRPVAEVELLGPASHYIDMFYVDSGADFTLIPYSVGKALGLSESQEEVETLGGVGGGSIPIYIVEIPLRIAPYQFKARIAWAQIEDVPLLLGRTDVFDSFRVEHDQQELVTRFIPYRRVAFEG